MKFIFFALIMVLNLRSWATQNVTDMADLSSFYFRGDIELTPVQEKPQILAAEVFANKLSANVKNGEKPFFFAAGKSLDPNQRGCFLERKVSSPIPKSSIRENRPGSLVWAIRLAKNKHQLLKPAAQAPKTAGDVWEDQFDLSFVTDPENPVLTLICRHVCTETKGLPKCEDRIPTDTTELLISLGNGQWKERFFQSASSYSNVVKSSENPITRSEAEGSTK